MSDFSTSSKAQLATCDQRLQDIANDAIQITDFTVLEGHRTKEQQERDYAKGLTKLHWPDGKHNQLPSKAMDLAPYPIDWKNETLSIARFAHLSGVIRACAAKRGIKVRFGWDWNRNQDPRDEHFFDWPHVELDEP